MAIPSDPDASTGAPMTDGGIGNLDSDAAERTKYTITECPYMKEVAYPLSEYWVGIQFDIEINVDFGQEFTGLRVQFAEQGNEEAAYVEIDSDQVADAVTIVAMIEEYNVYWVPDKPTSTLALINGVQIVLPANSGGAYDFDFCITNIKLILYTPTG